MGTLGAVRFLPLENCAQKCTYVWRPQFFIIKKQFTKNHRKFQKFPSCTPFANFTPYGPLNPMTNVHFLSVYFFSVYTRSTSVVPEDTRVFQFLEAATPSIFYRKTKKNRVPGVSISPAPLPPGEKKPFHPPTPTSFQLPPKIALHLPPPPSPIPPSPHPPIPPPNPLPNAADPPPLLLPRPRKPNCS